jgi:hypothetical protein
MILTRQRTITYGGNGSVSCFQEKLKSKEMITKIDKLNMKIIEKDKINNDNLQLKHQN